MTDHSIKELKRQMYAANSRLDQAELDAVAARKRYHDARVRNSGLLGKVVKSEKGALLVQDVQFSGDKPFAVTGFRINADGKAGFAERHIWLDQPHEVLPYEHGEAA